MMPRKPLIAAVTGVATLLAALPWSGCSQDRPRRIQNVVLIVADTLRADHLSILGGPVDTPHLDRLARTGARFERAFSHIPVTGPSHTSLFTGLPPTEHGVEINAAMVPGDRLTLAETLQGHGYQTTAFISLGVLHGKYGYDQGFSEYDETFSGDYFRRGGEVTDAAISWLQEKGEQPFFAWLHYSDPHEPYSPPTETYPAVEVWLDTRHQETVSANGYRYSLELEIPPGESTLLLAAPRGSSERTADLVFRQIRLHSDSVSLNPAAGWLSTSIEKTRTGTRLNGISALPAEIQLAHSEPRPVSARLSFFCHEDLTEQRLRELYAAETAYLDSQIGRVLRYLQESERHHDTLIVFTSDHGEGLGDHGLEGHIQQLYDSLLRVPLFVSAPGVTTPGSVVEDPVRLIDVAPTILDILGLPSLPDARGSSFLPLLRGGTAEEPRPVITATFRPLARYDQRSLIRFPFKYILNLTTSEEELYDLAADPQEFENLIERQPEVASQLRRELLDELGRDAPAVQDEVTRPELSQEEIDQLEALGYVE